MVFILNLCNFRFSLVRYFPPLLVWVDLNHTVGHLSLEFDRSVSCRWVQELMSHTLFQPREVNVNHLVHHKPLAKSVVDSKQFPQQFKTLLHLGDVFCQSRLWLLIFVYWNGGPAWLVDSLSARSWILLLLPFVVLHQWFYEGFAWFETVEMIFTDIFKHMAHR